MAAILRWSLHAIPAPTPRHAHPRVRTSSCETFISLITAALAGPAATVAHGLVGLVLANQTSATTAAARDQHLRPLGSPTSPTTRRFVQKPALVSRFSLPLTARHCIPSDLSTACAMLLN